MNQLAGVHPIAVPTPFLVGAVNAYLVEDDPLTLVDTGPNTGTALVALEAGLAARGHRLEDVERVVLTHQHLDHLGLAQLVADRSGAEVCALDRLVPWLEDYDAACAADDRFADAVMARNGIPHDLRMGLRTVGSVARGYGAGARVDTPLVAGGELAFRDRSWTVLHRPGHSPSDTVFHDRERRALIAGDHLLGHISSNPLVTRPLADGADRSHALLDYMASLRATRALELDLVLPGHGAPIEDHRGLVDERLRLHERRAAKILRGLGESGPLTAYEIALSMWGKVAVSQAFFTLSEVLGHLDLLVSRGQVREEFDGALARFAAV